MDPVMLPMFFYKAVYYIVRGDVFKKGPIRWFLNNTNQIPMFRMRDGLENVKRNDQTFELCYDLLRKKNIIMIFSEGDCVQEKHLRPFQKGTARMAFGAVEKYGWDIDLHLQASSVNYTHPAKFRTEVMVVLGEAFPISNYREMYESSPANAIKQVTIDLEKKVKNLYIELEHRDDQSVFEQLVQPLRNAQYRPLFPWVFKSFARIDSERNLSDHINKMRRESLANLEQVKRDANAYFEALDKWRLRDSAFGVNRPGRIYGILGVLAGFPFFAVGYLYNILAYRFVEHVIKTKIKDIIFVNSVRLLLYFVVISAQSALITAMVAIVWGWWAIWVIPSAYILSWMAINYYEFVDEVEHSWRYFRFKRKHPKEFETLMSMRQKLVDFVRFSR
jgi:1-acyl-sn-glycerol-3-phosphate acyltransferase